MNILIIESQCGFRSGRGTVDMIFSICHVVEKFRGKNQGLYMVFRNLTKTFNTINRDIHQKELQRFGTPKYSMFSFPQGMAAAVQWDGLFLTSFDVTNDTKANCIIVPVIFHSSLNGSRTPTLIFIQVSMSPNNSVQMTDVLRTRLLLIGFCRQFYTHSNIVRTDFGTNRSFFSCGVEHSCLLLKLRKQNPSTDHVFSQS